jgi:CYTH domain-containing protein
MAVARHFNAASQNYPEYIQEIPTPTESPRPTPTSTVRPKPTPTPDLGLEIERKFLVNPSKIPYDLSTLDRYDILQTYINFSPEVRIRKINGWMFMLTVKAAVDYDGMVREEREFWMTEQEYNTMYNKREGNDIDKTRYQGIGSDGVIFAIDIFRGSLKGLAYYEVEFATEQEANSYVPPAWVGKDVTSDKRYKNGSLAKNGLPADFIPAP